MATQPIPAKTYNCLVIDDSPTNRMIAERLLNKIVECTCVESGKEAVCCCKQKKFDIVVVDYQMAEMNGIQTVQEVKKFQPEYIVGCTSTNDINIVQEWKQAGADVVVTNKSWPTVVQEVGAFIHKKESPRCGEA